MWKSSKYGYEFDSSRYMIFQLKDISKISDVKQNEILHKFQFFIHQLKK